MIAYPHIDPVLVNFGTIKIFTLEIGPLAIHWYGMMYIVGLALAWWLGAKRAKLPYSPVKPEQLADLVFYCALGVVLGGRLGYVLFYDLPAYVNSPTAIFKVWQGGMSFHGGMLGVMIAMWLYGRKINKRFFEMADFVAPHVPLGLAAGRIGNFINGELWGRATDVPWAMIFPNPASGGIPRHPSQLYQAALEGLALFIILWLFSKRPRPTMAVSALFLIGYGFFRFIVEFVREPDAHLQFLVFNWVTMGQLLSLPMIIIGGIMMWWAYRMAKPSQLS